MASLSVDQLFSSPCTRLLCSLEVEEVWPGAACAVVHSLLLSTNNTRNYGGESCICRASVSLTLLIWAPAREADGTVTHFWTMNLLNALLTLSEGPRQRTESSYFQMKRPN